MAGNKKKSPTLKEILKMGKKYGVDKNALFLTAANQYALQQKVIEDIRSALDKEDSMTVVKEYVKGRENISANPLIKELPKHSDAANKTASVLLDIIAKLGHEQETGGKLQELMEDE